jgi:DMSO/TMAO reductase YedYZ molybdopterin-dependent catalytic subunit
MQLPDDKKDIITTSKISRRSLLAGAAAASIVLVQTASGKAFQAALTASELAADDPTKVPGVPPGTLGTRSPFEKPVKTPSDTSSRTPLQDLHGMITPSDLHYERHHGGVPSIDPAKYELVIHGMVDKPMIFTLADLKRFPSVSRIAFLECSGNYRGSNDGKIKPQEICGLTSQSEWTGVALSTLFREVGVNPKASWFLAEGMDAAVMTRSVPVHKGWDDAIIAYAQNGEAIRPEQGYPARLFLPGWGGQCQREMAETYRACRRAVYDPRRNLQIYRGSRRGEDPAVQLHHGRPLNHYLSFLSCQSRKRVDRDPRHCVEWSGKGNPCRSEHRRGQNLATSSFAAASTRQSDYHIPLPLELGG